MTVDFLRGWTCYLAGVVLSRAALHQTRFRIPGVGPDARGVVLGQKGLVLFPSLDRLVAFLRAYGEDGELDDVLPSLQIRSALTPLRTRELLLFLQTESSYRMDRIAAAARLAGGLVFTGTSRHFVRYRDAASPLGYDVEELADVTADAIVYDDTYEQSYTFERELPLRDLILRLSLIRLDLIRLDKEPRPAPSELYFTAETGLGPALMSYLFRWQVEASAALVEWPSSSAFEDRMRRLYLVRVSSVDPRIVRLVREVPGLRVYEPIGPSVAVELGYEHPLALDSCGSLFEPERLYLFRGDGEPLVLDPLPSFAPVRALLATNLTVKKDPVEPDVGQAAAERIGFALPLRLALTTEPLRSVVASMVPLAERAWLARLLYASPPETLAELQVAIGKDAIYLVNRSGIEGVPLGSFYVELARRIYVPAGLTLVPAVAPAVLEELLAARGDGHAFFVIGEEEPRIISAAAFGPVGRRVLRVIAGTLVHADRPVEEEPALPLLTYDDPRLFPLLGLPGKDGGPDEGGAG